MDWPKELRQLLYLQKRTKVTSIGLIPQIMMLPLRSAPHTRVTFAHKIVPFPTNGSYLQKMSAEEGENTYIRRVDTADHNVPSLTSPAKQTEQVVPITLFLSRRMNNCQKLSAKEDKEYTHIRSTLQITMLSHRSPPRARVSKVVPVKWVLLRIDE
jgi:hypothetical protein